MLFKNRHIECWYHCSYVYDVGNHVYDVCSTFSFVYTDSYMFFITFKYIYNRCFLIAYLSFAHPRFHLEFAAISRMRSIPLPFHSTKQQSVWRKNKSVFLSRSYSTHLRFKIIRIVSCYTLILLTTNYLVSIIRIGAKRTQGT